VNPSLDRILVFGASGRTGRRVVREALARGLRVAVFVRDVAKAPDGVDVHVGDVRDPEAVRAAVRAGDRVIATLGGEGMGEGARTLVTAARANGAVRVLAVTGAGVLQLDATHQRHEAPDYPPQFRAVSAEHRAVHEALAGSGLSWAIVATPQLVDADPTGALLREPDYLPAGSGAVTTGDVAALLVDEAVRPATEGRIGVNGR
jgi:putative NADH-flavin reductase